MFESLQGKTAIITGGSTELAGAIGLILAEQGANISLCGPQADLLEITVGNVKQNGGKMIPLVSELDTLEKTEDILNRTVAVFGKVDILILVSPFWSGGYIHNHNVRTWDLVMNANLREPFLMTRTILPFMREQKHGQIMSVGSDSAMSIYPQDGAYSVAMHGLTALMDLIRAENSAFGIRTHTVSPGLALSTPFDSEGKPNLTVTDVVEWVLWLLTRPDHLRGNSPILI